MKFKKEVPATQPEENEIISNTAEETETQEVPEKKGRKILNTVVNVLLVIAIIVAAVCTYISFVSASGNGVPSILGIEFFSIQTDSMADTLMPGDLAIGREIKDKSTLRPRDIITYWTVINGERVLNTHRIEAIYDGGNYLIFETKGDNNPSADPLNVHESEIVGKYVTKISGVGKVFDYLQTSTGFLVVIVIPVFLFFLFHLVQFFRVLFEYQNVKNRLRYEEERGRTEDVMEAREKEQEAARAAVEAKIREQLRAELLADMAREKAAAENAPPVAAKPTKEAEEPAEEAAEEPAAEEAAEEPAAEEPAAEEPADEDPAEEPKEEA